MSSTADKAKRVLTGATYAISALETIGELANGVLGKGHSVDKYVYALDAIRVAVAAVMKGIDGDPTVTQQTIEDALSMLRAKIASNDAAANAAVDAKFPKG